MKRIALVACCVLFLAGPERALAGEEPLQLPAHRLLLQSLTVLRGNPIGLEEQLKLGVQERLYESDNVLGRDNFLFLGIAPRLNPGYVRIGPVLELQPFSMLNLRVTAEYVRFLSTVGFVQSYGSPLAESSDTVRADGEEAGLSYATSASHFTFEPMLQAKVGPIAFRDRVSGELWVADLNGDDTVFYEASLDTLVPRTGWVLTNDADLLWIQGDGLVLGLRHTAVSPHYSTTDYQPGEDPKDNPNGHQRLGVLAAYTFWDEGTSRFNKPSLLAISSWYLDHRYRTGADVSRAVPYVVLGFAFTTDLPR